MFLADFKEEVAVFMTVKALHRIRTAQREGMNAREVVPQLFQHQRSLRLSLIPQQRDHLSKSHDPRVLALGRRTRLSESVADHVSETRCVRDAIAHELGES